MKRTWIVSGAVVAVLLAAGGVVAVRAHAMERQFGLYGRPGFGRGLAMAAWQLDLTQAQRSQIRTIAKSDREGVHPLLQQLASEESQMQTATQNGNFDQQKVTAIANEQSRTIAQLIVAKEHFVSQVYNNVLTPAQRTKAETMRQKWTEHLNQRLQQSAEQPSTNN